MRTKNQLKGDAAENAAIEDDIFIGPYEVERMPVNNPGCDYKRKRHGGLFIS